MTKRTVHVSSHYRGGKKVKGYSQHREAWRDAARKGAFAGAAGVGSVFLVIELGFTLISTMAIVATAVLTAVAGRQTYHAVAPHRTRSRPPGRSKRSAPGSAARRRKTSRKARWRARRRKTAKWTRRRGTQMLLAGARATGRRWRRMNGRPSGWDPKRRRP